MGRVNAFFFAVLALLACANLAQAGDTTTVINNSACSAKFDVTYESFLCADDKGIELSAGRTWSKGTGACAVDEVNGHITCGDRTVTCVTQKKSSNIYSIVGDPNTGFANTCSFNPIG